MADAGGLKAISIYWVALASYKYLLGSNKAHTFGEWMSAEVFVDLKHFDIWKLELLDSALLIPFTPSGDREQETHKEKDVGVCFAFPGRDCLTEKQRRKKWD